MKYRGIPEAFLMGPQGFDGGETEQGFQRVTAYRPGPRRGNITEITGTDRTVRGEFTGFDRVGSPILVAA